tara:strand:- start:2 stop:232 length:231 start_codon:yes stop_codon:yes gene_type:complete
MSSTIQENLKTSLQKDGMSEPAAAVVTSGVKKMDENNLKIAKVMSEQGMEAAAKQMFTHPYENRPMTYGEMRSFYG